MEKVSWLPLQETQEIQEAKQALKEKVYQTPETRAFIESHQIPEAIVLQDLGYFATYFENRANCENCQGYVECQNQNRGYECELFYDEVNQKVRVEYKICQRFTKYLETRKRFIYYEYDDSLFHREQIQVDIGLRKPILERIYRILNKETSRGLYIHGAPGVGKTYLLAFLAHQLVGQGMECALIKTTTLTDLLRSYLLADSSVFFQEMEKYKNVDVLILDDIGGEKSTPWIRDDVLYTLLDARIKNKRLITCFTSNYSLEEYQASLEVTMDKKGFGYKDEKKAERLISRIKTLADIFELVDLNRRL